MPRATSPGRPWASTWRRKTAAKPMSFPTAVTTDGSVVRAIAERPARSRWKRPTSSATKCWASAAEPPLPKASTRPPASRLSAMRRPTSSRSGALAAKKRSFRLTLSATILRMSSAFIGAGPLCARPCGPAKGGPAQTRRRWTVSRMEGTAGSSVRTWKTAPSRNPGGTCTGTGSRRATFPSPWQRPQSKTLPPVPPQASQVAVTGTSIERTVPAAASSGRTRSSAVRLAGANGRRRSPAAGRRTQRPVDGRGAVRPAELVVVAAPLLRVGQRLVGRLELREGVGRGPGSRRVEAPREPLEGPLDGGQARVPRHSEKLVVVLGLLHPSYTIGWGRKGCQVRSRRETSTRSATATRARPRTTSGTCSRGRSEGKGATSTGAARTVVRARGPSRASATTRTAWRLPRGAPARTRGRRGRGRARRGHDHLDRLALRAQAARGEHPQAHRVGPAVRALGAHGQVALHVEAQAAPRRGAPPPLGSRRRGRGAARPAGWPPGGCRRRRACRPPGARGGASGRGRPADRPRGRSRGERRRCRPGERRWRAAPRAARRAAPPRPPAARRAGRRGSRPPRAPRGAGPRRRPTRTRRGRPAPAPARPPRGRRRRRRDVREAGQT